MRHSSLTRRPVLRLAAAAMFVTAAAAVAVATPAAASAAPTTDQSNEFATAMGQLTRVYDATVVDGGAAVILPIEYWCDGPRESISVDVWQSAGRGASSQALVCADRTRVHAELRIEAQDGTRFVSGSGATVMIFAFGGLYTESVQVR